MNGFVNKQNCRLWDDHNPHEVHQVAMHPRFWSGGVIGPHFFKNDVGEAITVNGERYRSMINNFFWLELNNMDVNDKWF